MSAMDPTCQEFSIWGVLGKLNTGHPFLWSHCLWPVPNTASVTHLNELSPIQQPPEAGQAIVEGRSDPPPSPLLLNMVLLSPPLLGYTQQKPIL